MYCWMEPKIGGIGMSSFEERQAALCTQVLGDYCPVMCDLLQIEQHQQQNFLHHFHGGVSNVGLNGSGGVCNVGDVGWQYQQLVGEGSCYEVAEPYDRLVTGSDCPIVAAMPVLNEMSLFPSWRNQPSLEDSSAHNQPPANRPKTTVVACYTLEDILKKLPPDGGVAAALLGLRKLDLPQPAVSILPPPQFSSYVTLAFSPPVEISNEKPEHQRYRKPVRQSSVEPQSVAARHRRTKIREKIRTLERLIPQGSKLDTARMLNESIKYVKFLQAQVKVLESMPSSCHAVEDVKPVMNSNNGIVKERVNNVDSLAPRSNPSFWNVSGALSVQRPSLSLKKLSTQQMLHVLVISPTIQRKLFTAESCVASLQQKEMLANSQAFLSSNISRD